GQGTGTQAPERGLFAARRRRLRSLWHVAEGQLYQGQVFTLSALSLPQAELRELREVHTTRHHRGRVRDVAPSTATGTGAVPRRTDDVRRPLEPPPCDGGNQQKRPRNRAGEDRA